MKSAYLKEDGVIIDKLIKPSCLIPSSAVRVRAIKNITREYPTMYKILIYREPQIAPMPKNSRKIQPKASEFYEPTISSVSRTKRTIRDIVLCNDFDWFATFTFDPDRVNRYDYNRCLSVMSIWLHRRKTFDPDFTYLVIPEFHKDGAIHFHALLGHFTGTMKDSHHFTSAGNPIFNITCFRSGFTTASPIMDKSGVASYVQKYITKDFVKRFNRRRFFCSKNLKRPIRTVNSPVFSATLPIFRRKVSDFPDSEYFIIDKF